MHKTIAKNHADADKRDERQRLQNEMQHDTMLQLNLCSPLAVHRHQLLFSLDAVVVKAQYLALRCFVLDERQLGRAIGARRRSGTCPFVGLQLKCVVCDGNRLNVRLRLLNSPLNQLRAAPLSEPRIHATGHGSLSSR